MRFTRRSALLAFGTGFSTVTAGCMSSAGSNGSSSPTDTTPSPQSLECPSSAPTRPEKLTKETALNFTKQIEIAYIKEKEGGTNHTVTLGTFFAEQVKTVEDGFQIHLEYAYAVEESGGKTAVIGDHRLTVNYFVSHSVLRRAEIEGQESPGPDPRGEGKLVNC